MGGREGLGGRWVYRLGGLVRAWREGLMHDVRRDG